MKKIAIVTDSNSGITQSEAKALGIFVLPMPFTIEGNEYFEEKYPSSYHKGFADHSPLAECSGAAMAGLGILGEHSLLINEKYSSFVFIGEYITDLSREELILEGIKEGSKKAERCIQCGLCSAACPAGCADKRERDECISEITQKKGELTKRETELIIRGKSVWGCDICQNACPYTKKAIEKKTVYTPIEFFKSSAITENVFEKIPAMDRETFEKYPFAWRKRGPIERNIEILKEKEERSE